jgi:hypothetical protein
MLPLNELEKAVLEQIVERASDDMRAALKDQVDGAEVVGRRNTGAGFFTELKPGKVSAKIESRVISNVWVDIEGFAQSMVFLVFLEDGAVHTLEGASVDDSTIGVDFSSVGFTILP